LANGADGSASELSLGQTIHVFYDRTDPTHSCYCDPSILHKRGEWWRNLVLGSLLGAVAAAAITESLRRRKRIT